MGQRRARASPDWAKKNVASWSVNSSGLNPHSVTGLPWAASQAVSAWRTSPGPNGYRPS